MAGWKAPGDCYIKSFRETEESMRTDQQWKIKMNYILNVTAGKMVALNDSSKKRQVLHSDLKTILWLKSIAQKGIPQKQLVMKPFLAKFSSLVGFLLLTRPRSFVEAGWMILNPGLR